MSDPEYTVEPENRSSANGKTASRGSRTRRAYFLLSALWGFGTGAIALAVGAKLAGSAFGMSAPVLATVAVSVPVALLGGFVAAEAYREARKRSR
jgi:uncharacterized membrane protein YhaH (DUF805 family)